MSTPNILPDSRTRIARSEKYDASMGAIAVPVFCINCGKKAGMAVGNVRHIAVLCDPCGITHGHAAAHWVPPDHVYYIEARQVQMEEYGRILSPAEVAQVIEAKGEHNPLALLARDLAKPASRG